jgi:hypothetical protein
MTISQRGDVHGVTCDIVCTGRFFDFFERSAGRWGLVLRQPIYEKDQLDVVDPSARLALDAAKLSSFPAGYRHLAYLQRLERSHGQARHAAGAEVDALYSKGKAWLSDVQLRP